MYTIDNLPDAVKKMPSHAQAIWMSAFNAAFKEYNGDEAKCNATAWDAIQKEYEQNSKGVWTMMTNRTVIMSHDLNGVVPTEIQLLPFGRRDTPKYGPIVVDDESLSSTMAMKAARKNDDVIDYEHQTWESPPVEAPAAGWVKKYINKGKEGIWGIVDWTEKARRLIEAKEYRYFSPVTLTRKSDGKVMGLLGGGLTNVPNIDGMVPLTNKREFTRQGGGEKEDFMDKELRKLLGLPETATDAGVIVAINKLQTTAAGAAVIVANKATLEALGLKEGASQSEVIATIQAHKQAASVIEQLTTQVNKLTEELEKKGEEDIVALVNKAIEGDEKGSKLTPAQKDWAMDYAKRDPEGFAVFLNKSPYIVLKSKVAGDPPAGDAALDGTQVQVNKMLGIDAETFKKFGPKKEQ